MPPWGKMSNIEAGLHICSSSSLSNDTSLVNFESKLRDDPLLPGHPKIHFVIKYKLVAKPLRTQRDKFLKWEESFRIWGA